MTGISAVDLSSAIDSIRSLGGDKRVSNASRMLDSLFASPKKEQKPVADKGCELPCLGMDELESWARSAEAFQFSASRSEFSLSGNGFEARGLTESFQLEATFQQGDTTLELRIEVERTTLAVAYGTARQTGSEAGWDEIFQKLLGDLPETSLADETNTVPENGLSPSDGALRLTNLLKKLTSSSNDGSEDATDSDNLRKSLFDSLVPVIEQGLKDALELLGPVPQKTQDDLAELQKQTLDLAQALGSSK